MSFDKPFLNFVRAKACSTLVYSNWCQSKKKDDNQGTLTGFEAKEFYDSVVKTPPDGTHNINGFPCSNTEKHEKVKHQDSNILITPTRTTLRKPSLLSSCQTRKTKKVPTDSRRFKSFKKSGSRDNNKDACSTVSARLTNNFLKCAQEGQLDQIKTLLSETLIDINVTDQFSWTALMCAVPNGHAHVVQYLLEKGASWKGMVNSKGQNALDLARAVHNSTIIRLLEETELNSNISKRHRDESSRTDPMPFWCSICKQNILEDKKTHQNSTVHQFNCQHKPKGPYFSISEDNPGYKMMVKSGWDKEKGLGPAGKGRKFPIKTVLKRDRYGLGNEEASKARVTHFGPNDQSAVKLRKAEIKIDRRESNRTLSKKQRRLKESKEKTWERNMRIYMNS